MHCGELQYVVMCCSVLQCVLDVVVFYTLQYVTVCCNMLPCVAVCCRCCSVLQGVVVYLDKLQLTPYVAFKVLPVELSRLKKVRDLEMSTDNVTFPPPAISRVCVCGGGLVCVCVGVHV